MGYGDRFTDRAGGRRGSSFSARGGGSHFESDKYPSRNTQAQQGFSHDSLAESFRSGNRGAVDKFARYGQDGVRPQHKKFADDNTDARNSELMITNRTDEIRNTNFPGKTETESRSRPAPVPHKESKMGRIIIRNLPFKTRDGDLHALMSKCGKIVEVKIPRKEDGNMRGFGFVQFQSIHSAETAVKMFNATNFNGRPIAVDWAVAKSRYEEAKAEKEKLTFASAAIKEETGSGGDEQELDDKAESGVEDSPESDAESEPSEDDEDTKGEGVDDVDSEDQPTGKKPRTAKKSSDVDEGKTLFVRNLSFSLSEDALADAFRRFGHVGYARVCYQADSGHSKGSGFVQFARKEDADAALHESNSNDGIKVEDRRVLLCLAVTPKQRRKEERNATEKPKKDSRNLYLMHESRVRKEEEVDHKMSENDARKRAALEKKKAEALRNLHMFISQTRLSVHNLPRSVNDVTLKSMFMEAAGVNKYKISKCKVMCDKNATASTNQPKSLGFGFVEFERHEDALKALKQLNNNPAIFTDAKRPIVEFALENKTALLKQKTRLEHSQAKLKMLRGGQANETVNRKHEKRKENTTKPATTTAPKQAKGRVKSVKNAALSAQMPTKSILNSSTRPITKGQIVKRPIDFDDHVGKIAEPAPLPKRAKTNKKRRQEKAEPEDDFAKMVNKYKSKIQSSVAGSLQPKSGSRWFDE